MAETRCKKKDEKKIVDEWNDDSVGYRILYKESTARDYDSTGNYVPWYKRFFKIR